MMKKMMISLVLLSGLGAQADESSCNFELTHEPYCITIENAESYCKKLGKEAGVLKTAESCLSKMSKMMPPEKASAACLAGHISSSDNEKNKSNCGQRGAPGRPSIDSTK